MSDDKCSRARIILFLAGVAFLLALHVVLGFTQVPREVIISGVAQEVQPNAVVVGYALGVFAIYAIPAPALVVTLSLFSKKRRNILSITKVLFWTLLLTLCLNFIVGFIIAPRIVKNIHF